MSNEYLTKLEDIVAEYFLKGYIDEEYKQYIFTPYTKDAPPEDIKILLAKPEFMIIQSALSNYAFKKGDIKYLKPNKKNIQNMMKYEISTLTPNQLDKLFLGDTCLSTDMEGTVDVLKTIKDIKRGNNE